eukprot:TRINITY_DN32898_c0_g1_i1.p1 TRINITY_DN32898_c0_g1~~TRINITY_DN32898_c0_g1_i1.p1  ORF type:complete len:435 (-),score=25.76 TRINITY_DN32898_c0_g1_i1:253-1530(-)
MMEEGVLRNDDIDDEQQPPPGGIFIPENQPLCGMCDAVTARVECSTCRASFCKPCSVKLHAKGIYKNHVVYPVGKPPKRDLRVHSHPSSSSSTPSSSSQQRHTVGGSTNSSTNNNDTNNTSSVNNTQNETPKLFSCPLHPSQNLTHFSTPTLKIVCPRCTEYQQHQAKCLPLDQAYQQLMARLANAIHQLTKMAQSLQQSLMDCMCYFTKLKTLAQSMKDQVHTQIQQVIEYTKKRESALLESIDEQHACKTQEGDIHQETAKHLHRKSRILLETGRKLIEKRPTAYDILSDQHALKLIKDMETLLAECNNPTSHLPSARFYGSFDLNAIIRAMHPHLHHSPPEAQPTTTPASSISVPQRMHQDTRTHIVVTPSTTSEASTTEELEGSGGSSGCGMHRAPSLSSTESTQSPCRTADMHELNQVPL